jgi:hypothetical protein
MTSARSGKVQKRVQDSDPVIQQLSSYASNNIKAYAVRNADLDIDARSIVQCCAGFAPSCCTGAKADVRIRTFGPRFASHLLNYVPYRLTLIRAALKKYIE